MSAVTTVASILDCVDVPNKNIIETGCRSTRYIAQWAKDHQTKFENVSLDGALQETVHQQLESDGTAAFCIFHTQDPNKFLSASTWIDVAFLEPYDLQDGRQQFSLAISAGACVVVMYDYQQQAALAVQKAKGLGWKVIATDEYVTFVRS